MKILAVNKTDISNKYWYGGAEVRVMYLLREWKRLGHKVILISSNFPKALKRELLWEVPVYRYGFPLYRNIFAPFSIDKAIIKNLRVFKPDVVYLASMPFPPIFSHCFKPLRSISKELKDVKVVAHIAHLPNYSAAEDILHYSLLKLNEILTKTISCDVITTVSYATYSKIKKFFSQEIFITGNGVDTKIFKPLDIETVPHSVFSWGMLCKRKNFETLIKAFKLVKDEFFDARLLIAGEGPNKAKLIKLIKRMGLSRSVKLLGRITDQQLVKKINQAEVIVFPSLLEGFGLPIIESMACRKPVIASDIEASRELITNGNNGVLVSPKNEKAIAEAIIKVFEDKKLANRIAYNGFLFSHKFSWDKVAIKELQALESSL